MRWGDEANIYRQPTLTARSFPVGEEPTADLSHKANTRFRLCGALAAGTGAVTYVTGKKIGITKLCHFLTALRERYPIEKLWRWLRQEIVHHHCRADQWEEMKAAVIRFLEQFAAGSTALLRYVGLLPD